jgi:ADP-ribosyl-[dinitrogen reductase] hydrolase
MSWTRWRQALWAFATTETFESGLLRAVNLGGDADTVGAVYGQLAGAYYGSGAISTAWRERLAMCDLIHELATQLTEALPYPQRLRVSIVFDCWPCCGCLG